MRKTNNLVNLGKIYLGLMLLFLYLPIAIMAAMSFNRSNLYRIPI